MLLLADAMSKTRKCGSKGGRDLGALSSVTSAVAGVSYFSSLLTSRCQKERKRKVLYILYT